MWLGTRARKGSNSLPCHNSLMSFYMADITKDMSETLKNLAKTNYYLSEHSIKRY